MDQELFNNLKSFTKLNRIKFDAEAEKYLGHVIHYLTKELMRISGNKAKSENYDHIDEEDILSAVYHDHDFYQLLKNVMLGSELYIPLEILYKNN